MEQEESLEQLRRDVYDLRRELLEVRREVARLKGEKVPEPVSRLVAEEIEASRQAGKAQAPKVEPPRAWAPPPAEAREKTETAASPAGAGSASWLSERFVGEKLLHYVGVALLAIGAVFFLVWRAAHTSPLERAIMAALFGAAVVAAGEWARRNPPYDRIAHALVGGGWTILLSTAYAVYHFPAVKVVSSAAVELSLLGAAACGMIAHALALSARGLRLYGFGLTYAVFFFARAEVPSFEMFLILLLASVAVAVEMGEADILLVTLPGYYLNFGPLYSATTLTPAAQRSPSHFAGVFFWLLVPYLVVAALPLFRRSRERLFENDQLKLADAALCVNALLFALVGGSLGRAYFGPPALHRAAALSLLFAVPALLYLRRLKDSAAAGLLPLLAGAIVAAGALALPEPMWRLLAWTSVTSVWLGVGLWLDAWAWRATGTAMAGLTFAFYLHAAQGGEAARRSAAFAMLVFSAMSYLFSRFYRTWLGGAVHKLEGASMEYWLYLGSAGLTLGLWGMLRPGPFAIAMAAAAVAGELAAVRFGRVHLWAQACAVEVAVGVYCLFVDHGANLPILGPVTPRVLTSGCVAAALAWVYYDDPAPDEFAAKWPHWTKRGARSAVSWALFAVVAVAAYQELDPRLRLPFWAVSTVLLYWAGRVRGSEELRAQALLLCAAAGWDGVFGYLHAPAALMSRGSAGTATLYVVSALALLGGLFIAKDASYEGKADESQAGWLFPVVSLLLLAVFAQKELASVQLTMAWSAIGAGFLIGGLTLGYRELRLPGLGMLAVCVGKALLVDAATLPLPYRIASFVGLGLALLASSTFYVRTGNDD